MHSLFTSEELELDFPKIFGVSSADKPIKMGYNLSLNPFIDVQFIDTISNFDETSEHAAFLITYLDDDYNCLLIKNKGSSGFFYKRFKNIDYLLCSTTEEELKEEIIEILSKLNSVSICFALDEPNQDEILNFSKLL
ncbi:MAG: hypothetical protein KJP21_07470 [Bacteroidia bacterium]|nr:hypothetical protein [Bacteroidia bacterium]NNJ55011.1 hypothetical protein [Bacteroidia bacterium]